MNKVTSVNRRVLLLGFVVVVTGIMVLPTSAQLDYRVLSPRECDDTRGGECVTLTTLFVVAAVCTILQAGWVVIEETWDRADPGSNQGGVYNYPTQIRQASQDTGTSCQLIQTFDEVFEGYVGQP